MKLRSALLCLCWLLSASCTLLAQPALPYLATVTQEGARLVCGPGHDFYTCSRLPAGTRLEVLATHQAGFLAVLPPRGSTSWVAADDIHLREAGQGEVIRPNSVSWIGSQLNTPQDHRWQIQLKIGSRLTLHDQQNLQIRSDLPAARYYRVTPPAGEYRWIAASDISPRLPGIATGPLDPVRMAAFQQPLTDLARPAIQRASGWRSRHDESPPARLAKLPADENRSISGGDTGRQLSLMDARLAQLMATNSSAGQFAALRASLEQLLARDLAADQRTRARLLAARLGEYQQLQQQRISVSANQSGSIYDVSGWLMKVHAGTRRAPPFAILDDDGQVLEFASPAPGLNLHRYLKKRVGVFGYKSYLPELKTPHITVYRISDLARHPPATRGQ